eukprot:gene2686-18711_t
MQITREKADGANFVAIVREKRTEEKLYAFVLFDTVENCEKCWVRAHGTSLPCDPACRLTIDFSKKSLNKWEDKIREDKQNRVTGPSGRLLLKDKDAGQGRRTPQLSCSTRQPTQLSSSTRPPTQLSSSTQPPAQANPPPPIGKNDWTCVCGSSNVEQRPQ